MIDEAKRDFSTPAQAEEILRQLGGVAIPGLPSLEEFIAAGSGELRIAADARQTLTEFQYRTLLEQIPAVTFMASFERGLREVYVSPQIESLLGYTQREWLEDPTLWYARLHPGDKDRWNEEFAPLVAFGKPFHSVYRFLARSGRVVWLLGDARLVRDGAGRPLFIQGVGFDVTDLKDKEEKLRQRTEELEVAHRERREAEEALREIASTIRETFWVLSPSLDRVLYASAAFEAIWGRPVEALGGAAAVLEAAHPGDRERVSAALERMKSEETEVEHRLADRPRWVRSRTFPVRRGGSVVRVIAVSEDVTERKELELEIQRSREREIVRLRSEVRKDSTPEALLLGSSKAMKDLRFRIRKVAPRSGAVLITGESGAGKDLVARAIHFGSPRAKGPFVGVNCATLGEQLAVSELFGHEKGAFTGAVSHHKGKFEQAHGGTLFLDEIGEMPPSVQAMLLRALEERSFVRLGGTEKVHADVRVIGATNRNLEEAIGQGRFRQDLRYRFHVEIPVPALRERASDILELAQHFLDRTNREEMRQVEFSDAAVQLLKAHPWNGNVRELLYAVEQAVAFCEGERILPEDLPPAVSGPRPRPPAGARKVRLIDEVRSREKTLIVEALGDARGVKAQAARELGTNERNLTYRMNKLGIVALREAPWVKVH